ncbi:MAG TPA: hypothetical protein VJB98_03585 [Candidatus Paceibacterota bacterium]
MADAPSIAGTITRTLTSEALEVIKGYEGVPYYNNARVAVRGLRVMRGKGSPEEIKDEALIYALREKVDLRALRPEIYKKFLVNHNIGIDCSGLAYHILDTESRARGKGSLAQHLRFPFMNNVFQQLFRTLFRRFAENTDVRTFASPANSHAIDVSEAEPGDFFIRLGKAKGERDHMILISAVAPDMITLVQSVALPTDGRYGHGVRTEIIPRNAAPKFPLRRLNWLALS